MRKFSIPAVIAAIMISVSAGAIYMMLCASGDELHLIINEFLWNLKCGTRSGNIFANTLQSSLVMTALIAVCGFFRLGFIVSLMSLSRRCFVTGFTISAFIRSYGIKGFAYASVLGLPFMLTVPALAALSCASVSMSFSGRDRGRDTLRAYFVLTIGVALLFCAAALTEGYLVPILLRAIAK